LAGASYFSDESEVFAQTVGVNPPFTITDYGVHTPWALSAYAQGTYSIADNLSVTAGGRYSKERKEAFYNRTSPTPLAATGEGEWEAFTPSLIVKYEPWLNWNLYASYTQGFKSGTMDATTVPGVQFPVNPEQIDAFELGLKARPSGALQVNLAAFHYTYEDLQVQTVIALPGGGVQGLLQNAAAAEINGFESSIDWLPIPSLRLGMDVSLLDGVFTHFPRATVNLPRPLVNGRPVGNVATNNVNLTGTRLVRTPEYTFNFRVRHEMPAFGGTLVSNASYFISDEYTVDLKPNVQPGYEVLNASMRLEYDSGLAFTLTGRNLTDELVSLGIYSTGNADLVAWGRPAEVMLGVSYSF
jgi:iron complex outermembrane receptor protein